MRAALLLFSVAACAAGPSDDDVFGADTTLEYVTRVGSPQQETCLEGGSFALVGPNAAAALVMTKCNYAGVELDAATPLAVTWAIVDTPEDTAEDKNTISGTLALGSITSNIADCAVDMSITRTNRYTNGMLVSALISWQGTLCGTPVDVTRAPY